jgi:hypothetical protein
MEWSDAERRRRLVARHHLGGTAVSAREVVRSVAALHSSDPTTPYLACWARVAGFTVPDLEADLYATRHLWRMHTIRRTLFVVEVEDVPVFEAAAARDHALRERARLVAWIGSEATVDRLMVAVEVELQGGEMSTRELSAAIPDLARTVTVGSGTWAATVPVSSRLLFLMALEGRVVRTRPAGTWRSSQYRWSLTADWYGGDLPRLDPVEARSRLVQRYLATHGPVTVADIRWWTGWTAAHTKAALAGVGAREVGLEGDGVGLVLDGDHLSDAGPAAERSAAFLPSLDPTTMGWKDREWYLGPHAADLFDTNGNAGPTIWVDGRVVGGWGQRPDGAVVYEVVEELDPESAEAVRDEADRLEGWLDGPVVTPRFQSPLGRRLASL